MTVAELDPGLRAAAEAARGFLAPAEGLALYHAALLAPAGLALLEIGSYCGKSSIYLAAGARERGTVLFTVDHHRGSEEHQPGWEYHEPDLVDPHAGRIDTLPHLRRTLFDAGLEDVVVPIVGSSPVVARWWRTPVGLVFLDGSHTEESAQADYEGWAPAVAPDGLLLVHDVFPDPGDGGQAPFHVYERALGSGDFVEESATGSLRVLRRVSGPPPGRL